MSHSATPQGAPPRAKSDIKGFGYSVDLADIEPRTVDDMPPCFFVAGAPRCGTTAISKALSRNPRISFSKPKETHFLLDPPAGLSGDELRGLYLMRYHTELSAEHQAVGDGSVSYLYTPEALERALSFDPRARFIVMVRDPVAMLESYHARLLFMLDEDVTDFAKAWALQERRAQGLDIPKRCRDPRLLMYGEAAKHGAHVQRLYELAGRERCMVVVFDDWANEPRPVYQRVLAFLGVDDDGRTDFSSKRESAGFRSTFLQSIVMNPPRWLLRVVELSDTSRLEKLKALRKRIKRFNTKTKPRPQIPEEMRAVVRAHFADDVELLSSLLGRDLSHWR